MLALIIAALQSIPSLEKFFSWLASEWQAAKAAAESNKIDQASQDAQNAKTDADRIKAAQEAADANRNLP